MRQKYNMPKRTVDMRTILSESRVEQLQDARDLAAYSRRLKQRSRLEQQLVEVNERLADFEATDPEAAARKREAPEEKKAQSKRCSSAGKQMHKCAVTNREQRAMLRTEAERQEAAEVERQKAERAEAARVEAARVEAERAEVERQKAERAETAR
eukprot:1998967-Prymnesium_polylepis.2